MDVGISHGRDSEASDGPAVGDGGKISRWIAGGSMVVSAQRVRGVRGRVRSRARCGIICGIAGLRAGLVPGLARSASWPHVLKLR